MQDIVVIALIVGFGLMFLGRLFSSPPQPPTITYIPVIREPAAPQSSGCGTLLVAMFIILVLFFLLGSG